MRRLCFDTESSAYNGDIGVLDVETSRGQLAELHRIRPITFHCAVVCDENEGQFEEFTSADLPVLVAKLAAADVLISRNGRRWDLPILEQVCGANAIAPLWAIEHKDLIDWELVDWKWQRLDSLAQKYIPDRLPGMELAWQEREAEAAQRFPGHRWGSCEDFWSHDRFIAHKLAKARFDVERTFAVFGVLESRTKDDVASQANRR